MLDTGSRCEQLRSRPTVSLSCDEVMIGACDVGAENDDSSTSRVSASVAVAGTGPAVASILLTL